MLPKAQYALHHQPLTTNYQPNGRTSYLRECYQKRSTRFTTNHQPPTTNHQPLHITESPFPKNVASLKK
ncbi:MAG: hypothetical protein ACHBN1_17745 [Heteroscytonema crispum UTEX LB 1556]